MTEADGRNTLDFDAAALRPILADLLGHPVHHLDIRPTEGGMSNPTYFVTADGWRAVLRKQPAGKLAKSAHAIDREYRVLSALEGSAVPVPRTILYHEDPTPLGTPFYLMEWIDGTVMPSYACPGLDTVERGKLFRSMAETLAALHRVDPVAVGLDDYGKPGNYFARQVARWSSLWAEYRAALGANPALDRLTNWLRERIPESETTTLCHGDFRIGNMVFRPNCSVAAVLDWELSTLGHPLVDLAFNTQAWHMAPDENGGLLGLDLPSLGIPDEESYLAYYYAAASSTERLTDFHRAFAMFRAAVGSAGVAVRGAQGNNTLPDSVHIGRHLARAYAERGLALAERSDP